MAKIKISKNEFKDYSQAIGNYYEAPKNIDFSRIEKELYAIRVILDKGTQEYMMVKELEQNSKLHNWDAICSTIKEFSLQFSSATLANLVGNYLSTLLRLWFYSKI